MQRKILILIAALVLASCAGPVVTRVQPLAETADAPYDKVLVVSLFELFDTRRWLETAIVRELEARGVTAVASTAHMNSQTPVTRQTFLKMVDEHGSDAVLVSHLISLDTTAKENDSRPESTYIVRPTYYYNVWSVELTEYVEPPFLTHTHNIRLASQVYSVNDKDAVWGIESKSRIVTQRETQGDTSFINDEAAAIVRALAADGLIP